MIDWTHWHTEPLLTGTLLLAAWAYALGTGPWRAHLGGDAAYPIGAGYRFAGALVVFYLAVGSPLDQIGERYLLSAHMVQHMLIVYLAAPLAVAGCPAWLIDTLLQRTHLTGLVRMLTHPVLAGPLYVMVISFWHFPAAYDFALQNKLVHVGQHLTFFAAAVPMWWPLFSPSRLLPPIPPGAQMLYLIAIGGLQMPLVALLALSRNVFFPTYEFAPRITSLTPLEDQVLAGAIMGVGGMFIGLGLITWSFVRWYQQSKDGPDSSALGQLT